MFDAILSRPPIFIAATFMWFVHGFVLDVMLIGVLPFVDPAKSDKERADKFPWAMGGYVSSYPKVPNLAPTHRRFMTENAAYALVRIAPIFCPTNVPILFLSVLSYLVEALTIAWEICRYSAPGNAMLPLSLMCVFSSVVTYAATTEWGKVDGFIDDDDLSPALDFMQAATLATFICWVS